MVSEFVPGDPISIGFFHAPPPSPVLISGVRVRQALIRLHECFAANDARQIFTLTFDSVAKMKAVLFHPVLMINR